MSIDLLSQARALLQAGRKAEARRLLEPYLKDHLQDIPAWLMEADAQPTADDKSKILQACLRYNPHASQAQEALTSLETDSSFLLASNGPTPQGV